MSFFAELRRRNVFRVGIAYAQRTGVIQPGNPNRYWGPGLAYQAAGQLAASLEYQIQAVKLDPNDYELPAGIASIWLSLGDLEQAESWAKIADEMGADQPSPIATRVQIYEYREQYGLAADMAKRALDRKVDNRLGTNFVLKRAYVSNLVRQGDIPQAIAYFQAELPGAFETPLNLSRSDLRRRYNDLLDIALLLQIQDSASEKAIELINIAEQQSHSIDDRYLPRIRSLERAKIAAARRNKAVAIEQLEQAYDRGLRWRWQSILMSNIAFNSLHDEPEFKQLISRLEEDMQGQREQAYQIPGVIK